MTDQEQIRDLQATIERAKEWRAMSEHELELCHRACEDLRRFVDVLKARNQRLTDIVKNTPCTCADVRIGMDGHDDTCAYRLAQEILAAEKEKEP